MCTLVVAVSVWASAPLVVAANRDEQLARPAAPPHVWARDDEPLIFAPRDLLAGGTWLGIRGAMFVGITNRFMGRVPPPGPRSRGELVLDALAAGSVDAAAGRITKSSSPSALYAPAEPASSQVVTPLVAASGSGETPQ